MNTTFPKIEVSNLLRRKRQEDAFQENFPPPTKPVSRQSATKKPQNPLFSDEDSDDDDFRQLVSATTTSVLHEKEEVKPLQFQKMKQEEATSMFGESSGAKDNLKGT